MFFTQLFTQRQKKNLQVHKKPLNEKECLRLFNKNATFINWARLKPAKPLATAKQLIRKTLLAV